MNVSIWSLWTSTGLPNLEESSSKKSPAWILQLTTFDTFDQSQHLLHTLHKSFFVFQLHFTFLEIIKHNMPKMLLSPPSSTVKWPHKNSPILMFFKCMLIWQLSQYNLTKLFQVNKVKKKTTTKIVSTEVNTKITKQY